MEKGRKITLHSEPNQLVRSVLPKAVLFRFDTEGEFVFTSGRFPIEQEKKLILRYNGKVERIVILTLKEYNDILKNVNPLEEALEEIEVVKEVKPEILKKESNLGLEELTKLSGGL